MTRNFRVEAHNLDSVGSRGRSDVCIDGSTHWGKPRPSLEDEDHACGTVRTCEQAAGSGEVVFNLRMGRAGGGVQNQSFLRETKHEWRHLAVVSEKPFGDSTSGGKELLDLFRLRE